MADISITQTHKLTHKKAKAAAQKVADKLEQEYDMASEWDGDVLHFQRSGVTGTLTLLEGEAQLEIKLGFLLKAFAPTIEEKVSAQMKKVFSAKA
jgi:putative polyhydroxyalkanoate system protein